LKPAAAAPAPAAARDVDVASSPPPLATNPRFVAVVAVIACIVLLALMWRFGPLREHLDAAALTRMAAPMTGSPLLPLAVLAAFVLGGLLVIPLTLMIAATGLLFGPVLGAAYALTCATVSSVIIYALGRLLGRETLRRFAGPRINALSRRLATRGVATVFLIRVLPIAPFTLVSAVAGASHIRLRDFVFGTLAGLTPGTLLIVFFVDRIADALRSPDWRVPALVLSLAVTVLFASFAVKRRVMRAARTVDATQATDRAQ